MSDHDHLHDHGDHGSGYGHEAARRAEERRSILKFALSLLIPAVLLVAFGLWDKYADHAAGAMDSGHPLRAAAGKVDAYSRLNPPRGNWLAKGVRIVDDETLVLDVELPSLYQASVIASRRARVKYAYVKLACPPAEAGHRELMTPGGRVRVALRYQGRLVAEGSCPAG